MRLSTLFLVAIGAMMIAITTVFTMLVRIPIPATQGYFNFSSVAINFSAFTFGPWVGLVSGGVGTAIADVIGGYPQFAILTLIAHGLEGFVAGLLGRHKRLPGLILAWLAGGLVMVAVYFLGEGLILTGWGPAAVEVPANLLQSAVGAVVGIPLFYAVRQAYPPIMRLGGRPTWREEN